MLDHLFTSVVLGAGALAASVLGFGGTQNFADHRGGGQQGQRMEYPGQTSFLHQMASSSMDQKQSFDFGDRRNASTTPAMIACVKTAVVAREARIDSGLSTFNTAASSAFTARASALASAYSNTSIDTVRSAVKVAWTAFNTSMKAAQNARQASERTALNTFRTSARACHAPASLLAAEEDTPQNNPNSWDQAPGKH